jgi:tetratricopeptide (TPR) repeat protein
MTPEAYETLQKVLLIAPHPIPMSALVLYYVKMGQREQALEMLDRARSWSKGGGPNPRIAVAYVALGQPDSALTWLERAEWDRGSIAALRWDPMLNPIRSHPRYHRLLAGLGIPADRQR